MDLHNELANFSHREITIPISTLFPSVDVERVRREYSRFMSANQHKTVFDVSRALWDGGYEKLMKENGFWDDAYKDFSGHCHQCSPVLGLVLKSLGFSVSFLECFRIRESYLESGLIEQVPPQEELNLDVKQEFCDIGRIPYCCLEVMIDNRPFYITGKHLKPSGDSAIALLSPVCYRDFVGVFHHQSDNSKSGIYLQPVNVDSRVVWQKQTQRDPSPELFAEFLRMRLV